VDRFGDRSADSRAALLEKRGDAFEVLHAVDGKDALMHWNWHVTRIWFAHRLNRPELAGLELTTID